MKRPWTEDERAYLRAHVHDQTAQAMGKALDRTPNAIFTQCCRLGLVHRPLWTPEDDNELRTWMPLAPLAWIAARLGRSETATRQRAQKLGLRVLSARFSAERAAP